MNQLIDALVFMLITLVNTLIILAVPFIIMFLRGKEFTSGNYEDALISAFVGFIAILITKSTYYD